VITERYINNLILSKMKTSSNVNKHTSNDELKSIESIYASLKSGDIVVTDIEDTKNPEMKLVYMAQIVNIGTSSNITSAQAFLKGWATTPTNERIERAIDSFSTEITDKLSIGDGLNKVLGTTFSLQIVDSNEKSYDNESQRITRDGEAIVDSITGKPIYRKAIIVDKSELKHSLIKGVTESKYAPSVPMSKITNAVV
jgi:hypothetical protein